VDGKVTHAGGVKFFAYRNSEEGTRNDTETGTRLEITPKVRGEMVRKFSKTKSLYLLEMEDIKLQTYSKNERTELDSLEVLIYTN